MIKKKFTFFFLFLFYLITYSISLCVSRLLWQEQQYNRHSVVALDVYYSIACIGICLLFTCMICVYVSIIKLVALKCIEWTEFAGRLHHGHRESERTHVCDHSSRSFHMFISERNFFQTIQWRRHIGSFKIISVISVEIKRTIFTDFFFFLDSSSIFYLCIISYAKFSYMNLMLY